VSGFYFFGGFSRRVTRVIISNFQTRFVPFWNKMKKLSGTMTAHEHNDF
jgi:hypothetical protein